MVNIEQNGIIETNRQDAINTLSVLTQLPITEAIMAKQSLPKSDPTNQSELTFHPLATHKDFRDLTGCTFGRRTVLGYLGMEKHKAMWLCLCKCGTVDEVSGNTLLRGQSQSCGCLKREATIKRNTSHGLAKTPEYRVFHSAKGRCNNPNNGEYPRYGGRGIQFCLTSVEELIDEIGVKPSQDYSLDRIDSNGNYEKGNLRWATKVEQGNNTRKNHYITIDGETKSLPDWCRLYDIGSDIVRQRIRTLGWCDRCALALPVAKGRMSQCNHVTANQERARRLPQSRQDLLQERA